MKKLFMVAIAALLSLSASAQLVTSNLTKIRTEKEPSTSIWFVRGGLTFANYSWDSGSTDSKTGYNVSLEFNKTITNGLYWGSGIGLKSKGSKDGDESINLNALEIPLNVGYKFAVADDVAIDVHAGGFANYDLFGNINDGEEKVNLGDWENYSKFGYGLSVGAGVWYKNYNLNLTIQKGLAEQFDDIAAKESNVMLSVGYAF